MHCNGDLYNLLPEISVIHDFSLNSIKKTQGLIIPNMDNCIAGNPSKVATCYFIIILTFRIYLIHGKRNAHYTYIDFTLILVEQKKKP